MQAHSGREGHPWPSAGLGQGRGGVPRNRDRLRHRLRRHPRDGCDPLHVQERPSGAGHARGVRCGGESSSGKASYGISPSVVSFIVDTRAARPWDFLAEGFSSLQTIPSGGCRAPSSTGCGEIRQVAVCPFLRGNEREWPTWSSSSWPETRCASFGTHFQFSVSMPKATSNQADSKSSNSPS